MHVRSVSVINEGREKYKKNYDIIETRECEKEWRMIRELMMCLKYENNFVSNMTSRVECPQSFCHEVIM